MRIAQIAPLWETVPPPAYGGIELVVSLLTDELVKQGHDVTLFASGDSQTLATLESVHPQALRLDTSVKEVGIYETLHLTQAFSRAPEFDVIHSHMGCAALPYTKFVKTPVLHTLHGVFTPDNEKLFRHFRDQPYVSISNAQREPRLGLNCVATVYNGIALDWFDFYPQPQNPPYLAFLGRMSPEKGPHLAIEIAQRTGWHLKMAGKVDPVDRDYFQTQILPHVDGQQIEYLGEANHAQKNILMGNAVATLFPITWREPFGLVMVESMATGTPVLAMNLGSAPEVVVHGETGYLCNSVADYISALEQIDSIDRYACRAHIHQHFNAQKMTADYEAVYYQLLSERGKTNGYHPPAVLQMV